MGPDVPFLGRTHSAAALADTVPELREPRPLVTVEVRVPSLMFYLDRVPEVLEMHRLEELRPAKVLALASSARSVDATRRRRVGTGVSRTSERMRAASA